MNRPIDIAKCSSCGDYHRELMSYDLPEIETVQGFKCPRYTVCPHTQKRLYLAYKGSQLFNLLKGDKDV